MLCAIQLYILNLLCLFLVKKKNNNWGKLKTMKVLLKTNRREIKAVLWRKHCCSSDDTSKCNFIDPILTTCASAKKYLT